MHCLFVVKIMLFLLSIISFLYSSSNPLLIRLLILLASTVLRRGVDMHGSQQGLIGRLRGWLWSLWLFVSLHTKLTFVGIHLKILSSRLRLLPISEAVSI
jgi:hypothetical protein